LVKAASEALTLSATEQMASGIASNALHFEEIGKKSAKKQRCWLA
jgi:hypothetical protein